MVNAAPVDGAIINAPRARRSRATAEVAGYCGRGFLFRKARLAAVSNKILAARSDKVDWALNGLGTLNLPESRAIFIHSYCRLERGGLFMATLPTPPDSRKLSLLRRMSQVAAVVVIAVALAVLSGWVAHIPELLDVLPGLVAMKFNTAVSILCCGAALLILSWDWKSGRLPEFMACPCLRPGLRRFSSRRAFGRRGHLLRRLRDR